MPLVGTFLRDASGAPVTGATPTIDIVNADTDASVVAAAPMTELSSLGGMYVFDFTTGAGWTTGLRWVGRADFGAGLGANRYQPVFPVSPTDEAGDSARLDADGLETSAVNEIRDSILADSTPFNGADIAAILLDTDTTIPALIAALNDLSVADILTAVLAGSGESVDTALSRLDNIDSDAAAALAGVVTIIATGGPGPWTTGAGGTPAAVASAVWSELLPGGFPAGSAGLIVGSILAAIAGVRGADSRDLSELAGAGWLASTDTLEEIRNAIDALVAPVTQGAAVDPTVAP